MDRAINSSTRHKKHDPFLQKSLEEGAVRILIKYVVYMFGLPTCFVKHENMLRLAILIDQSATRWANYRMANDELVQ